MNLSKERDRDAFWRAWRTHLTMLRPFRASYKSMVEEYAGSEYAMQSDYQQKKTLFNLMFMSARAQTLVLTANRPRVLVTTRYRGLRAFARKYQTSLNRLVEEIKLEKTLRRVVLDAYFVGGFVKIYYAPGQKMLVRNPDLDEPGPEASEDDWASYRDRQNLWIDPGKPFVERLSIKDLVFDMSAESWETIRYATHQYRVPYEWVLEDDRLDHKILKEVGPTSKWGSETGVPKEQTTADISKRGHGEDNDELEPMITLCDYWLSSERRWGVTIPNSKHKPLYEERWAGPKSGPFKMLSFAEVPDNVMPAAPAYHLKNLHMLTNQMLRKASRQALNQKTVGTYTGDGKDAQQIQSAMDQSMVRVNNQDSVREHTYNGVDRMTLAFSQVVDGLFNRASGNLDAKMGTASMAETATQESLIHQAVTNIDAKEQMAVVGFTADVCSDLGHLLWNDKVVEIDDMIQIPGIRVPIKMQWRPGERDGDFFKYAISVEPYSMMYRSPRQRMTEITQVIQQVYGPLMPFLLQAGGSFDMEQLTELIAEWYDMPKLTEIITFAGKPVPINEGGGEGGGGGGFGAMGGAPHEYIRKNVSTGGSPDSQRSNLVQRLASGSDKSGGNGSAGGY